MAEISLEYVKEMMAKGNVEEAMKSLASMLQSNNKDIVAWLFLAELMDDPVKKRVLPAGLEVVTIQRRCFEGMEKLDSSNVRRRGTDNVNGLSTSSDRKVASESRQTRRDNSHSQKKRRQSKGYFFMWTSVLSAICIFSFIFFIYRQTEYHKYQNEKYILAY